MSMADPLAETSPQASGPGSDVASLGLSPSASVLHPSALPTVGVQVTNAEQATIPGTSSSEHTKLDASLPDTSVPASLPSIEPARAASDLIGEDAGTASKRENDVTESIDGLAGVGGDNKKARVSACNVVSAMGCKGPAKKSAGAVPDRDHSKDIVLMVPTLLDTGS